MGGGGRNMSPLRICKAHIDYKHQKCEKKNFFRKHSKIK